MLEILVSLLYAVVLLLLLDFYRRKKAFSLSRVELFTYYFLKLSMAFGLTALYTYYYTDRSTADIYKFFDDSAVIHQIAFIDLGSYLRLLFGFPISNEAHNLILNTQHWDASADWGGTGNRLMTRVHLLIRWFSFGNIWVHATIFSTLSVLGFMWFYRALSPFFQQTRWIFLAFLMPSVLFWSSGMLKETILLFFMGMLMHAFHLFRQKNILKSVVAALLASLFILVLKAYIWIVFLPILLGLLLWRLIPFFKRQFALSLIIGFATSLVLINVASELILGRSFLELLSLRYNDFLALAIRQEAGSLLLQTKMGLGNFWQWMFNGVKHTWLIPWPWSAGGVMIKMAGVEHFCFMLLLLISVFALFRSKLPATELLFFFAFFLFSILLFQFIGLTTPVLGAIVRYKMPAILFATLFFAWTLDQYFSKNSSRQ